MTPPFERVLVANRGEIACRIMSTLDRLGIESVAVFAEPDRTTRHVRMATLSHALGGSTPAQSYLRIDAVIQAALATNAGAIHPGYGLLSESPDFAQACQDAGIVFLGPTPEQIRSFALKHRARTLAEAAGVPVVPGSGALKDLAAAKSEARNIGFPVMLKASAGGGGIGMRVCADESELTDAYESVVRLADNNFADSTLMVERFVERARHVEVQLVGDGNGAVVHFGDRDCSTQRRRQKVIEEAPAPGLSDSLRDRLRAAAVALGESVDYRSAGTVEFVVDAGSGSAGSSEDSAEAWFLEVNTRLQVEHPVTEAVYGVDLVEWMIRIGAGETLSDLGPVPEPHGSAFEARVYAEDPSDSYAPSSGLITCFEVPADVRCDTWIDTGTEVTPYYDPLLAKVVVAADTRSAALDRMAAALAETRIESTATNLALLRHVVDGPLRAGPLATTDLEHEVVATDEIKVIEGGLFSTVQDLAGRTGYWHVGIPPSGSMDTLSHSLVNRLLDNPPNASALEVTLVGPTLEFRSPTAFALGGANIEAHLDGEPVPMWTVVHAPAGSRLALGTIAGPGARTYLGVAGGFCVPEHLGSTATFVLGGFGGHGGRAIRAGDVLSLATPPQLPRPRSLPQDQLPAMTSDWEIEVISGPHGAPDYFTPSDIATLHDTAWEVHFNSDRTGIRLIGPAPQWAREDGGEAGLHPSNIHDNAYAIGAIDFTGDMPIILGRDGPSLGGFVCPATVADDEFWKVGQLRAGDRVRFSVRADPNKVGAIATRRAASTHEPALTVRRSGDRRLLVEYGPEVLDLVLRARVQVLADALAGTGQVGELVPGIRSLQVEFDPTRLTESELVEVIHRCDQEIGSVDSLEMASRIVRLPLAWDDPTARLAAERYAQNVRPDAPWCPWNLEFIRRINGLETVEDVKRIVFDASYLVMGLGDVYLGAPVATPIDPRHRLVTTKYNPARTWTAENAVGIGGSYLCIYGMEGPGGYQLIGRTLPIWDRWQRWAEHEHAGERPWLLRNFDQIRWYEVSPDELLDLRASVESGTFDFDIEPATFSIGDHVAQLQRDADQIAEFTAKRNAAFAAERERWEELDINLVGSDEAFAGPVAERTVPDGSSPVSATVSGVMWEVDVEVGDRVETGQRVASIEAMKMETEITAPAAGTVVARFVDPGDLAQAGDVLVAIAPQ